MDELTWICHICGDERPDDKISVYKHIRRLESGIEFIENVRYCNDKESCIEAAKDFHFL
jgi:hypothetical protein